MTGPVFPTPAHPSLESLPAESPIRKLYPEDFYPNGNYFQSPHGRVRYYILGPEDGPKVTLIHGISAPSIAYTNIARSLADRGFRVLLFDLYGRGYSQAPTNPPDSANPYIIELALLLQYISWTKTDVVGFSLGGGIAAAFASAFPHLINGKVVFIASAGLLEIPEDERSGKIVPPVKSSNNPDSIAAQLRRLQTESLTEFRQIVDNDLRYGPATGLTAAFKSLASATPGQTQAIKALIIHGTADDIVPYGEALKIQALVPQAQLVTIEGASHYLVFQEGHWQKVADNIASFLIS